MIENLSKNIIKTREIFKDNFDEYTSTLMSFDKIKGTIKSVKQKNDTLFNDCSTVFSKKFQILQILMKMK